MSDAQELALKSTAYSNFIDWDSRRFDDLDAGDAGPLAFDLAGPV